MANTKELSGLIKKVFTSQRFAVLATQSEGQPYSSLISFAEADNLRSLIFVTSRAMSVPAGMIDINLFTTSVTMINMPAHRLCSAVLDVSDGSFMRSQHGTREPFQVQWPELTHDVSQFDCHYPLFIWGWSRTFRWLYGHSVGWGSLDGYRPLLNGCCCVPAVFAPRAYLHHLLTGVSQNCVSIRAAEHF